MIVEIVGRRFVAAALAVLHRIHVEPAAERAVGRYEGFAGEVDCAGNIWRNMNAYLVEAFRGAQWYGPHDLPCAQAERRK